MDVEYPDECVGLECRNNAGCDFCVKQDETYYIEVYVVAHNVIRNADGNQEMDETRLQMIPEFCPFCGSRMPQ